MYIKDIMFMKCLILFGSRISLKKRYRNRNPFKEFALFLSVSTRQEKYAYAEMLVTLCKKN